MKNAFLALTIIISFGACQQENNELQSAKDFYELAQQNRDATTTKVALNKLILLDSSNIDYKDSLARLYMKTGNYKAGVRLADEVYTAGKADNDLTEDMSLAYQQLGEFDKSEDLIDKLFSSTRNYKYQYQKLVLQYNKGNQAAFDTLATDLLSKIDSDSSIASTTLSLPGPVTGVQQEVPIKAATLFIIGNNAFDREQNLQKAVNYFQKSIQEFEQFELARYSLQEIERMYMANRR